MKTKATILTFLFYTVVSGHEEEASRLATSGVSHRFRWFHRLGSRFTAPAPADTSVEVVSQPRAATTSKPTTTMTETFVYHLICTRVSLCSLL